jgi:GMP synthase (glutamine-hydrolysing)
VCFGSQLIAEALGGKAAPNPQGWEIGNTEVVLTQEGLNDPLFEGFPECFEVIQSHQDCVLALPPDAVLLATNRHCPVQAYGIGDSLRAVQFHPEMDACHLRFILPPRRDRIRMSTGLDVEELMPKVHDTPGVKRIFDNFLRNIEG